MEIRNRLFTYPVLCEDTDDYISSDFYADYTYNQTAYSINITFDIKLTCPDLVRLIRTGKAEFVIHIECPMTSYRKAIKFENFQKSIEIQKNKVNGEIAVLAMVVAKTNIENYESDSLNDDYNDDIVNFERCSILAYENLAKISILKDYEELAKGDSLFRVVERRTEDDSVSPIQFALDDDRIKIYVDENTYRAYINYQQSTDIALSLLVLPAVVYMIEELSNGYDNYSQCDWLIKIEQFFKKSNKDFKEDLIDSDKPIIEIAQEMLNYPICKAYDELLTIGS